MRARWLILLAPLLMAHRCGPTREEAGAAGIMSAFLGFTAVGLLLWILVWLWDTFVEPTKGDGRGWWRAWSAGLVVALVALFAGPSGALEWTGIGFFVVGSFVLLYSMMGWRWQRRRADAVWFVPAVVAGLASLPGLAMLMGADDDLLAVWIYGSGVLWGGPVMYGILLIEVVVRALRKP